MIVKADNVAPTPWKNGGGWARDLLLWPDAQAWQVRISLADITTHGPFSAYPGVQRWFAVVQGDGVALQFAGRVHTQRAADAPLYFDGAEAPACRLLNGPTRDLNLMLRGGVNGVMQTAPTTAWPLHGCFDIDTCTLAWGASVPGVGARPGPALWLGVAP